MTLKKQCLPLSFPPLWPQSPFSDSLVRLYSSLGKAMNTSMHEYHSFPWRSSLQLRSVPSSAWFPGVTTPWLPWDKPLLISLSFLLFCNLILLPSNGCRTNESCFWAWPNPACGFWCFVSWESLGWYPLQYHSQDGYTPWVSLWMFEKQPSIENPMTFCKPPFSFWDRPFPRFWFPNDVVTQHWTTLKSAVLLGAAKKKQKENLQAIKEDESLRIPNDESDV